jgi:hypothetical protein
VRRGQSNDPHSIAAGALLEHGAEDKRLEDEAHAVAGIPSQSFELGDRQSGVRRRKVAPEQDRPRPVLRRRPQSARKESFEGRDALDRSSEFEGSELDLE